MIRVNKLFIQVKALLKFAINPKNTCYFFNLKSKFSIFETL